MIKQNVINILIYFLFLQIINIGVSYRLAELLLALIVKKKDLEKNTCLSFFPRVALLYVTYNDAIPKYLKELSYQNYSNYDIYILDDSDEEEFIKIVNSFDYKILRRTTRSGFKAGCLNNWLRLHGNKYKYFIISDSDSSFDKNFIKNMVVYAEHESNRNVAIFQSKILPSNIINSFSEAVGLMIPIAMYVHEKLGNDCKTILSWGHNNLHRTKYIKYIGGFDENFVAEDYATSITLIKKGFDCKLVDVISYEEVPQTIQSYTQRYIRWAKQTIELRKISKDGLCFATKLHLFMGFYTYTIWIIVFLGMTIAAWGYSTSSEDVIFMIDYIVSYGFFESEPVISAIILFYVFDLIIFRLPLVSKLSIPIIKYWKSVFLTISIHSYIMFLLTKSVLKTLLGEKVRFEVTKKGFEDSRLSFMQILKRMDFGLFLNLLLLIGIINNPLFLFFNYLWTIPLLLSPIVIYLLQEK